MQDESPYKTVNQQPMTASEVEALAKGPNLGGPRWKRMFKESRAYLVEYFLILISTGIMLGVIIAMLSNIIDYTDSDRGASIFDSYAYTASVSMIAALLVVVPLIVLLSKRIQGSEAVNPALKDRGWRKGFLGIFLIITSLFALGYTIAFMYTLVSYFASFGLGGDAKSFPWRGLLENGVAAGLFTFTAWLYSYDYRLQKNVKVGLARLHHYGLIGLSVLFTIIYLSTAFQQQRGAFIDDAISGDISAIRTKVETYESKNNKLPGSLKDLDLSKQQESRADKFNYEYSASRSGGKFTLCAEFKTDTTDETPSTRNPLEALSGSSYDDYYQSDYVDPYKHDKGKECFDFETYSSSYDPYQYKGIDDQSSSDNGSDDETIYQD